ncbi:hypothetical protein MHYP_G00147740 [Metynnis hypsauchen]
MDAPSKFFFNLERKNGQSWFIHSLRSEDGQELTEPDIRKRAVRFYSELYRSEYKENGELASGFYAGLPKVSEQLNAEIERPLDEPELHAALQSMEGGTAPGIDGLLAIRLRDVMGHVIHLDQTYCVPGRTITDIICLIRDVLEVSNILGVDSGLISLDQEKAFDRVEHQYLWYTLEAFGFSPSFIAMRERFKCQLLNFILSEAKLAVYTSRRNRVAQTSDDDAVWTFSRLVRSRILIDFNYYKCMSDLETFEAV